MKAEEFDRKFDAERDVTDALDLSSSPVLVRRRVASTSTFLRGWSSLSIARPSGSASRASLSLRCGSLRSSTKRRRSRLGSLRLRAAYSRQKCGGG